MRLVILESPYAGNVESNIRYARECIRNCLQRDESPLASHLLFTQEGVLNDDDPDERILGIAAGVAWRRVADATVFYTDRGWSRGMLAALSVMLDCDSGAFELRALHGPVRYPEGLSDDHIKILQDAAE